MPRSPAAGEGQPTPLFLIHNSCWFDFAADSPACPGAYRLTTNPATFGQADAVLFHLPSLRSTSRSERIRSAALRTTPRPRLPRAKGKPEQLWVAVSMESSVNYRVLEDAAFMRRFDLSMTYRWDSDIPLAYLESEHRADLLTPPVDKTASAPAVYFASNPSAANRRDQFVSELMRHLPVDCYGRSLKNRLLVEDRGRSTKLETIARYRFTLAFENSGTVDYVTEKFFDPLIVGSVPVYMGAPNVSEFAPAPNSFIDVRDFAGPRDVADHLIALQRDAERYATYLSWKREGLSNPACLDKLSWVDTPALCRLADRVQAMRRVPG
jgi:hypothetical protein